jgi:hypothetical protein
MPTRATQDQFQSQDAVLAPNSDQTSRTWRRLYVPQVGHAVCCNFGCWHCGQAARAAAVVFHWLRRERVFERDIFRFGTGTFRTSSQSLSNHWAAEGKYPLKGLNLEIGVFGG